MKTILRSFFILVMLYSLIMVLPSHSNTASALSEDRYLWPVETSRYISSNFGYRPNYSKTKPHSGIDIYCEIGTQIRAAKSGDVYTVVNKYSNDDHPTSGTASYGNYLMIHHDDGTYAIYAHLSPNGITSSNRVAQGDPIALSGSSGNTTGPHLHFQVIKSASVSYSTPSNFVNTMPTEACILENNITVHNTYYEEETAQMGCSTERMTYFFSTTLCSHSQGFETVYEGGRYFARCKECHEEYNPEFKNNSAGTYRITSNIMLNSAPYQEAQTSVSCKSGQQVTISGHVINAYNNKWYQTTDGYYIYHEYAELVQQISTLSVSGYEGNPGTPSGTLTLGSNFGLRGIISSNYNITHVEAHIYDSNNRDANNTTAYHTDWNSKSYNIQTDGINNHFSFRLLEEGSYRYVVSAQDSYPTTRTLIDSSFTVGSGATEQKSVFDLNGWLNGNLSWGSIEGYGTVDVYINGRLVESNVNDFCAEYPVGTSYEIKNIRALDGCQYDGVHSGSLTGTIGTDRVEVYLAFSKLSYLNLDGLLDGTANDGLGGYGVADVYINGNLVANGWNDYWEAWPAGTTYEIKNIRANEGYQYNGVHSGSLSGTIGTERVNVVLSFSSLVNLNLDGFLDGSKYDSLNDYGTADVYINGSLVASGCSDYWEAWPTGTTYEIKNIIANPGYHYNGVYSGSLSGTIGMERVDVILMFSSLPTYIISYDANGGNGGPTSQIKSSGKNLILSDEVPIWEGYVFRGWKTTDSNAYYHVDYSPGDIYMDDADLQLWAHWSIDQFNVYYFELTGGYLLDPETHTSGNSWQISEIIPEKSGYRFKGWHLFDYYPYIGFSDGHPAHSDMWSGREENDGLTDIVDYTPGQIVSPQYRIFEPGYEIEDCYFTYILTAVWEELGVIIDANTFPDPVFREYVSQSIDKNKDGYLSNEEIAAVKEITVYGGNESQGRISSLKGIECFTELEKLDCSFNQLPELDISQNTALKELDCVANLLTDLNTSNNSALQVLWCSNNQLTSIDVSSNTALKDLSCVGNKLTTLNVSNNTLLESLACGISFSNVYLGNQLTSLDVSNNTNLTSLYCDNNQLLNLNVTNNPKLLQLTCSRNQLTELDLSNNSNLLWLSCWGNRLGVLNVSCCSNLHELSASNNILTELNITGCTELHKLYCSWNQLQEIDISTCPELQSFECGANPLGSLDLSNNPALTHLGCFENQLTELDLSNNTALQEMWCYSNQLDRMDLSACPNLYFLSCWNNKLSTLNIRNNTALQKLFCYQNLLSNLDVSACPNLVQLTTNTVPTAENGVLQYADQESGNFGCYLMIDEGVLLIASLDELEPDLVLPAMLTSIEDEAFADGAFVYVKLPDQAVSIGWHAFADCPNLAYIYIPAQTTQIDAQAFGNMQDLTILGKTGSVAQTYAQNHNYTFIAVP